MKPSKFIGMHPGAIKVSLKLESMAASLPLTGSELKEGIATLFLSLGPPLGVVLLFYVGIGLKRLRSPRFNS
jgi:hypothetical protein